MNNGWQTKKLGELCEIELGRTPARANATFWDEKRETSNVWLSIADLLKAEDSVVVDSKEYVSDKGAEICKLVPKGTLLVSFKLTLGRLAFAGRDLFTNEAIAALTIFNERELSKEFLFYFLHFFDWVKAAENDVKLKGMTLNKAKLKEMNVHFPKSLPEQQRIVGLLDESFAGIATAKANAEKNLQNARALFASHLQSAFSQRGKGWVEMTLESCCKQIFAGGDVPKGRVSQERTPKYSVPIFSNGAKDDGLYGFTDVARVNKPSITVSARGTIGFSAIRTEPFLPVVRLIVLIPDEKLIELSFLYYAVVGMDFGNTGTSIPQLTVPNFKECKLRLPPLSLQKAIVENLNSLREETQRLASVYERKLAALAALKRSLLHQAFTGQLEAQAA